MYISVNNAIGEQFVQFYIILHAIRECVYSENTHYFKISCHPRNPSESVFQFVPRLVDIHTRALDVKPV